MSKQDLLNAVESKTAMAMYLEVRDDAEIISDIRSLIPPGLTKRDYFAAAALTGLGTWTPDPDIGLGDTPATYDMVSTVKRRARWAVAQADALIAASKTGGPEHG